MRGELQEQTIEVTWKATEMTAKVIKELIAMLMARHNSPAHGEQKLEQLNAQNRQLESVDISATDLKAVKQELKQYSVDFSVKKVPNSNEYKVFFKGQDVDRVYQGLSNYVKGIDNLTKKKPMQETIKEAEKEANDRAEARKTAPKKEQSVDRGQEI